MNKLFKYNLVNVRFVDQLVKNEKVTGDLYCAALARSVKKGKKVVIDCRQHKCAGGNYFVGGAKVSRSEIEDVYVNKEFVLKDAKAVGSFLKAVGRNPVNSRYVVFDPVKDVVDIDDSSVVLGIANAENVGRILGLIAFEGEFSVDVVPGISTCAALYRPLVKSKTVHLNFVDYFDRNYQCKGFYEDSEIVVSMDGKIFKHLNSVYLRSAHGKLKPKDMPVYDVSSL